MVLAIKLLSMKLHIVLSKKLKRPRNIEIQEYGLTQMSVRFTIKVPRRIPCVLVRFISTKARTTRI